MPWLIWTKRFVDTIDGIEAAPEEEAQPALKQRLLLLTERSIALLDELELVDGDSLEMATAVAILYDKLTKLQIVLSNPQPTDIADITTDLDKLTDTENDQPEDSIASGIPISLDNPLDVPFPEGSLEHDFFS